MSSFEDRYLPKALRALERGLCLLFKVYSRDSLICRTPV